MKAKTVTSKQFERVKVLLERIISCKYEVLAEYRHISTVWAVSSLLTGQRLVSVKSWLPLLAIVNFSKLSIEVISNS